MEIPGAAYRIQYNRSFGFQKAVEIIPYLAELGISTLYASPIFKARAGSSHGYDVVDFNMLNPELGDPGDFEKLIGEIKKHGMSWLQDIVPNHMAYDSQNGLLMDVLEQGKNSRYFDWFDIEWDHFYEGLRGKLLAPFLGKFYAESLQEGEIQLAYDESGMAICYYDLRFPLAIHSYVQVFKHNIATLGNTLGGHNPDFIKFLGILDFLDRLASQHEVHEQDEQYDQTAHAKGMLWELYAKNQDIRRFMDSKLRFFNGQKGKEESYDSLDELLREQSFRLSFWKVAAEEINYRRFFNINELISLRVENESVFHYTHNLLFKLIDEGKFDGLRIDHIDGLYDPMAYLTRLRKTVGTRYIVVEKILDFSELFPSAWPVQGTTGYDFMNHLNGIFCKSGKRRDFIKLYYKFTGLHMSYEDLVYEKKRLIIRKHMAGNIDNLAHLMKRIASRDRYGRDVTLHGLREALVDVMACFPVYRTYINHHGSNKIDTEYIREAIEKAQTRSPGLLYELDFIQKFLLRDFTYELTGEEEKQLMQFVMRFQQFTGPLMAKGFEDTVLYIYNKLISLNEVGGNPNRFGISLKEFHALSGSRASRMPHSLNATSTHDSKRGEDVRARINVLSEMPHEWKYHLKLWSRINRARKTRRHATAMPDANDEYFLYQTLIGAFPFKESEYSAFRERIARYIVKAVREAKVHTAWIKPDTEYEEACIRFSQEILDPADENRFLEEFLPFQRKVAYYGIFNTLSQTLIKITNPGVPDFYQGTELWDLNLVDPDNRRPVDFRKRTSFLQEIQHREQRGILSLISELLDTKEDGKIKLFLVYRALKTRNQNALLFREGAYVPLKTVGKHKECVIAYARHYRSTWVLTIALRFLTAVIKEGELPLGHPVWEDTGIVLPDDASGSWHDAITDQVIESKKMLSVGNVLRHFPGALLISH